MNGILCLPIWFTFKLINRYLSEEDIVNKNRPVNLDLLTIKFPIMAICSILHRLSGLLLFILIPVSLCLLSQSLQSEHHFSELKLFLTQPGGKCGVWVALSALSYHLLAGVRHMLMDFGFAESVMGAKRSAMALFVAFLLIAILLGAWLW